MRILVISDLPHFVTGGAEMQAMRLIDAWLDAGHEVVCLGRRMSSSRVEIGRHSIKTHKIRTTSLFGRWGRASSYFISLTFLLFRYRKWADVVYTRFLNEAAATVAILKATRLLAASLVSTPASTHGGDTKGLGSLPFSAALIRLLDQHCDAINLIAGDMGRQLLAAGFSGRNFTYIPNGITIGRPPSQGKHGPLRFVAIGRLAPPKGYDILLQALSIARHDLGHARVRIIGDGPERAHLHALSRNLQVDGYVEWIGELHRSEVASELEHAHVFLLPSRYEGMSNAGLEAMERGLPLITSRCGGLDHYVNSEIGWVVPVEDEAALADALREAMTVGPERLAAMGVAARACAETEFDMQVIAGRYLELFGQLSKQLAAKTASEIA